MKPLVEIIEEVTGRLEREKIPYMIVGSVASMVYGEPRMTRDMDIVIEVSPSDAGRFEKIFPETEYYTPPAEIVQSEIVHRGQFNLIHHETGLKVDLMICKEAQHSRAEFSRKKKVNFWEGFDAYLATPEDVIIKKLEFYRSGGSEKHLSDIRGMLAETEIDLKYVETWITSLGLKKEWERASK